MKSYLLRSVALFSPDDAAADPEAARKAAIQVERDKIKVETVKIEDDNEKVEAKDETDADDNDKEKKSDDGTEDDNAEDGDKSSSSEEEREDDEPDKEELKAKKKLERLEKKVAREEQKRREAEKEINALRKKLEEKPDKTLTEDDVKTEAKKLAQEEKVKEDFYAATERLADGVKKQLKISEKQLSNLIEELHEEVGEPIPAVFIGALDDIENGTQVLAHMLKNPDVAEELYKFKNRPTKLGMELAKLSSTLAKPKMKAISKVPDPVEPLGGKSSGGDRLAILAAKKNLTSDEMAEYVQVRNQQIMEKRKHGRMNLR